MLAFLHFQSREHTLTVLCCSKCVCKAKNHLAAFHREFLSSSINQTIQATIQCSAFSNCLCYLLAYVCNGEFSVQLFSLPHSNHKISSQSCSLQSVCEMHTSEFYGEILLMLALWQSPRKVFSPSSCSLVPCVLTQKLQ